MRNARLFQATALRLGLCLGLLLTAAGCDRPPRPSLVRSADQDSDALFAPAQPPATEPAPTVPADSTDPAGRADPSQPFEAWETWDAYFTRGEHVGYSHVRAERVAGAAEPTIAYTLEDQITLRRGATQVTQLLTQKSIERIDGTLESFDAELRVGPALTTYHGQRQGDQVVITVRRGSQQSTRTIPWQPGFRGLVGVQQSLRDAPLQPGQSRQIQALLPIQYQTGTFQLRATAMAAVPLLSGKTETLLEIQSRLQLSPEVSIDTVLWVDQQGNTLKALTPALDLISYRTDAETATADVAPTKDLLAATSIAVDRVIDQPAEIVFARYRVAPRRRDADPDSVVPIPTAPGQRVRPGDRPGQQVVFVRAGPDSSDVLAGPTAADSHPGPIIDSADARITALANQFIDQPLGGRRAEALWLAESVHDYVQQKDFSRAFSTASQVASDATGDCTEHSVLLAALLRVRQIPSRVAAGLVYVQTADGPVMAYHMWTLAYVDQAWLPLDATLDQIPAAADRITLVTSDLASGDEYDCLLPILGAVGRLRIEILQADTTLPGVVH